MAQENVEVVRALVDAWNAHEMDRLRELYDPTVIVRAPEGWPEPGPWLGPDAIMRQWNQMRDVWNADEIDVMSDLVGLGDRVVGRFVWRGTGRGPEADLELTGVWTVRDGRIFHTEFFWDHADALKALGLEE